MGERTNAAIHAGWRTLAEPTYGVSEDGEAVRLNPGTNAYLCPTATILGPNVPGGRATAVVLVTWSPLDGDARRVVGYYVTATALRFEVEAPAAVRFGQEIDLSGVAFTGIVGLDAGLGWEPPGGDRW